MYSSNKGTVNSTVWASPSDAAIASNTATTTVTVDDRFEPNNTRATAALLPGGCGALVPFSRS